MSTHFNIDIPWKEAKEKLKEANYELTDEDLQYVPGEEERLLNHLSKKLSMSMEAVKDWIESVAFTKRIAY